MFHSEFDTLLDSLSAHSCPVYLLGDVNIHLDDIHAPGTDRFSTALDSRGLHQLVKEPTHVRGHTLDVVIASDSSSVTSIQVDPPVVSDHSLIDMTLSQNLESVQRRTVLRRAWSRIDRDAFLADLSLSELGLPPVALSDVTVDTAS